MRLVIDPSASTSLIILNLLMFKSNSGPVAPDEMIFVKHNVAEFYTGFTYYNVSNARYCHLANGPSHNDITVAFKRFPPGATDDVSAPVILHKHAITTNPQEAADWIAAYVAKGDLPANYY